MCGVAATKDQIAELMGTVCTLLTHIAYNSPEFKWCIALHAIDPLLLLLVRRARVLVRNNNKKVPL